MIHRSYPSDIRHVPRVPRLSPTRLTRFTGRVTCRGDTPPNRNTAYEKLQSGAPRGGVIREFSDGMGLNCVTWSSGDNRSSTGWGQRQRGDAQLERGLGQPIVFDAPVLMVDPVVLFLVQPPHPDRLFL